jgi:phosphate starvation-inducible protein PhoH
MILNAKLNTKDLIIAINGKEIIISAGAAGVGSYVSIAIEFRSDDNKFNKIIISTPIVEADEN